MSADRLEQCFAACRRRGDAAFIAYTCAGDPDLEATGKLVRELAGRGADIIELGVPFTDAVADGPTIQAASDRALAAGTTLGGILGLVKELRRSLSVPLVLMSSLNPLLAYGGERLAPDAAAAGVDGFIIPDLCPEEAGGIKSGLDAAGLSLPLLVAPSTPPERRRLIVESASGFIYYVSLLGITGARDRLPPDLTAKLTELRRESPLPVAVGFGISRPEQVKTLAPVADGIIVGSAIVRRVAEAAGGGDWIGRVGEFVAGLVKETRGTGPGEGK